MLAAPRRRPRAKAVLALLATCLLLCGAYAATRFDPVRRAAGLSPLVAPAVQTQGGLPLAKEYVYAGGRLIATEAPSGGPAAPSNLRIPGNRYMSPFKGSLAWDDNSADETGFKIEKFSGGSWSQVTLLAANSTGYSIDGACGDSYRVRATNALGDSDYSNVAVACIEEANPAPTGLRATAAGGNSVSLSWAASGSTANHYEVERKLSVHDPSPYSFSCPASPCTDSSAAPWTAYLYRVRAVSSEGVASAYGEPDVATTAVYTGDDPLIGKADPQGRPPSRVRAADLTEMRRAVDAVRTLAEVGGAMWKADPAPQSGGRVLAAHFTELRANLNTALSALGMAVLPDDATLGAGLPVKAAHLQNVREKVR